MKHLWTASLACVLGGLALVTLWSHPAGANPFFHEQTGKDCMFCHMPGREMEGKTGLNPMGQAFLQTFDGCGGNISCAVAKWLPSLPPNPGQQPTQAFDGTTQTRGGMARFSDHCGDGDYFVIRLGGAPDNPLRFMVKKGHHVDIDVPAGSTYSGQCDSFPGQGANFSYIRVE